MLTLRLGSKNLIILTIALPNLPNFAFQHFLRITTNRRAPGARLSGTTPYHTYRPMYSRSYRSETQGHSPYRNTFKIWCLHRAGFQKFSKEGCVLVFLCLSPDTAPCVSHQTQPPVSLTRHSGTGTQPLSQHFSKSGVSTGQGFKSFTRRLCRCAVVSPWYLAAPLAHRHNLHFKTFKSRYPYRIGF